MITSFKSVVSKWLQYKKEYVKESTMSVYEEIIKNHLMSAFGKCRCIDEKSVQKLVLEKLSEGLSQKMVKDIVVVLKMICVYGKKNKMLKYESFEISYPTIDEVREVPIFSKKEQKRLIEALMADSSYKAIGIVLCLMTGLRIGELCALRVSDVDFVAREIKVNKTIQRIYMPSGNTKTKVIVTEPKTPSSNRVVPISSAIYQILKEKYKALPSDSHLLSGTNKPVEPRSYRKYFANTLDSLNIKRVNFHALRHTFATRCIESNSDYKTVSSLLGHSNISTTLNLYVHPNKEQKRKCIERMIKSL